MSFCERVRPGKFLPSSSSVGIFLFRCDGAGEITGLGNFRTLSNRCSAMSHRARPW